MEDNPCTTCIFMYWEDVRSAGLLVNEEEEEGEEPLVPHLKFLLKWFIALLCVNRKPFLRVSSSNVYRNVYKIYMKQFMVQMYD